MDFELLALARGVLKTTRKMAGGKDDSAIRLPFSNDGSFLENFKRLQDAKNSAGASQSGGPVAPTPIKLKTKPAGEKPSLKPCLGDVFENEDGSTSTGKVVWALDGDSFTCYEPF